MDNAGVYAAANPLQKRDAAATVQEFVMKMQWGRRETVLDVGCGPGDVTAEVLFPMYVNANLLTRGRRPENIRNNQNTRTGTPVPTRGSMALFYFYFICEGGSALLPYLFSLSFFATAIPHSRPSLPRLPVEARCVGVDLSDSMVHHAAANHGHKRLSFCQLDISTKDEQRVDRVRQVLGALTKVFSFYCLHWVCEQR